MMGRPNMRTYRTQRTTRWSAGISVACAALMGSGVLVNLAAPTSSASMLRPDAATVTLQFWNTYNPADKEASTMQNVVLGKFEQENPGIKVESIQIPYGAAPGQVHSCGSSRQPARRAPLRHCLGTVASRGWSAA